jgi:hypothetical protein
VFFLKVNYILVGQRAAGKFWDVVYAGAEHVIIAGNEGDITLVETASAKVRVAVSRIPTFCWSVPSRNLG